MKLEQEVLDAAQEIGQAVEEWRSVRGYKGLYEVSNMGRVRSVDRVVKYRDGRVYNYKGKILSLIPNKAGYIQADLYRNTKYKTTYVHILVLKAFKRQPKGKTEVNHRNGIKHDNRLHNLHWCTRLENVSHAISEGLSTTRGSNCHNAKLTNEDVLEICRLVDIEGLKYKVVADKFSVSHGHVRDIVLGNRWNWLTNRNSELNNVKYN